MRGRRGRAARGPLLLLLLLAAVALWPGGALAAGPRLSARSALVVEASTSTPLFGRAALRERPIASTTKLMTAWLTLRRVPLGRVFTVPGYSAGSAESQIGLRPGERMRVDDLLRALLLPSANDAAATLAAGVGGSRTRFVRLMNVEARRLGLRRTHYSTPVGLDDPGNYSDAFDLTRLATLLRRNRFFAHTVDQPRAVLRSGSHRRVVVNRNTLVRVYPWVNGVKTGHTSQAGYVLVGSATRGGMTLVSAVLGTPSESARDADSLAVLRFGFAHFHLVRPVRARQHVGSVAVRHRGGVRVAVLAARGLTRAEPRSTRDRLVVRLPRDVEGPLRPGTRVGTLVVRAGGRDVARIALVTARAVPAPSAAARLGRALGGPFTLIVLAVLGGGGAALLWRRRAARRRRRARPGMGTA